VSPLSWICVTVCEPQITRVSAIMCRLDAFAHASQAVGNLRAHDGGRPAEARPDDRPSTREPTRFGGSVLRRASAGGAEEWGHATSCVCIVTTCASSEGVCGMALCALASSEPPACSGVLTAAIQSAGEVRAVPRWNVRYSGHKRIVHFCTFRISVGLRCAVWLGCGWL